MIRVIIYSIISVLIAFVIAYFIGRFFATGIMDGINHRFNQFTKLEKDDNKEKEE
jgi:uncharacterized membrane protein YdjX (TVP38/TMEM64 family)